MGSENDNQSNAFPHLGEDEPGQILSLKDHQGQKTRAAATLRPEIPSWEEIFPLLSPHSLLLQALLAPADSAEEYYQAIFQAALEVGLRDPALLLGLLWHAPRGDALKQPQRWDWLADLVTSGLQEHPATPTTRESPAYLEEQIAIPRYRYEAMLLQLRQLAARASELERQLAQWADAFVPDRISPEKKEGSGLEEPDSHPLRFLHDWTDLERQVSELVDSFLPETMIPEIQQEKFLESLAPFQEGSLQDLSEALKKKSQHARQEDEIEAAIQECLQENPDLAEDERKVEMLRYCLKNYVNFHPDLMGLPPKQKVAEACRMARDFLGDPFKSRA